MEQEEKKEVTKNLYDGYDDEETASVEDLALRPFLGKVGIQRVNEWMFTFTAFLTKLKKGPIVWNEMDPRECDCILIYHPNKEVSKSFISFLRNHLFKFSELPVGYCDDLDRFNKKTKRDLHDPFNYYKRTEILPDGSRRVDLCIDLAGFEKIEGKNFQWVSWERNYGGIIKCKYEFI